MWFIMARPVTGACHVCPSVLVRGGGEGVAALRYGVPGLCTQGNVHTVRTGWGRLLLLKVDDASHCFSWRARAQRLQRERNPGHG